jgi:hypothetical protein
MLGSDIIVAQNTSNATGMLLYDRLFDVAKTMSSSGTESVTGVPTRYQGTTQPADDFAGGNFCFPEIITTIPNTAHNWTVCTYTDQGGNPGTFATVTGLNVGVVGAAGWVDIAGNGGWFMPLASGDNGVQSLTQMQCSSNAITGTIDFVIGHPLAWIPATDCIIAGEFDSLRTAFNLVRVFDDACLTFMLGPYNSGTSGLRPAFRGMVSLVRG